MKQGEIWNVDLNPVKGSEQAGFRPVVIVSGNLLNDNLGILIIIPLTTKIKNYKGNPILEANSSNGLKTKSEMLVFHVRSILKDRLIRKIGSISKAEIDYSIKTLNEILRY